MSRAFDIINVEQRTPEWIAARLGRVTGSTANDFLAKEREVGKGMRSKLRVRLALERITGKSFESDFQSEAMDEGIRLEPEALLAYRVQTGQFTETTGFLQHTELMAGCSLDAHIGDFEGLVSIKCPKRLTHLDTLLKRDKARKAGTPESDGIPADYMRQIVHEQFVSGARWTDYVSFNPDFPGSLALCIIRVERDEKVIEAHELALRLFLTEVENEQKAIAEMAGAAA